MGGDGAGEGLWVMEFLFVKMAVIVFTLTTPVIVGAYGYTPFLLV